MLIKMLFYKYSMATLRGLYLTILSSIFFIFSIASAATYLSIQGPISTTLYNNGSVYLGKVGPGESFYILANASTTNNSGYLINIGWDTIKATNLPRGWYSQQSPLYENPMKIRITVSQNATNGRYPLTLKAINVNNYSKLGNLTFTAYVNVTTNVFALTVLPKKLYSGVDQPATIYININNTGISDDPFLISAIGLPSWNVTDSVISLHGKKDNFTYPIFLGQPGLYKFNLTVSSSSSSLVSESYPMAFQVNTTLYNDYKAIGSGVILSPVIFEPAYAFMSLLESVYSYIFH